MNELQRLQQLIYLASQTQLSAAQALRIARENGDWEKIAKVEKILFDLADDLKKLSEVKKGN